MSLDSRLYLQMHGLLQASAAVPLFASPAAIVSNPMLPPLTTRRHPADVTLRALDKGSTIDLV